MTAFDSPLLISKPVCLHVRPTVDRLVGEQRLVTLLERRRRKYLLARSQDDSGKADQGDELDREVQRDHSVHVISNLRVDDSGMHQRRQSPVYETHFRHTGIELVSEVMLPTKTRTRAKNLKSKLEML